MQALSLLTRGRLTQGYYRGLALLTWGRLFFRYPNFYVPGDFTPTIVVKPFQDIPVPLPAVFLPPITNVVRFINREDTIHALPIDLGNILTNSPSILLDTTIKDYRPIPHMMENEVVLLNIDRILLLHTLDIQLLSFAEQDLLG